MALHRTPLLLLVAVVGVWLWSRPAHPDPDGVVWKFACDQVSVTEAIDAGGGDWNYRYTASCLAAYLPKTYPKPEPRFALAPGPRPQSGYLAEGRVIVTGVGSYRRKTHTVHDKATLEGRVVTKQGVEHTLELDVQGIYRCTGDPFVYHSGGVCVRKKITVKGAGWPRLRALTQAREVPFGTWGITLAARNEIATKAKTPPPPPPPPPKKNTKKPKGLVKPKKPVRRPVAKKKVRGG